MTEDEMQMALKVLVKQGRIWANCPRCTVALSYNEYVKKKCGTCGKFNLEDVRFYPKTDEC